MQGMGTIEMWSWFKEQILCVLDRYVPVRQGGSDKVRELWFTKEIVSLVKWKREAYVTMRRDGSVEVMESYRLARKDLKIKLRRARTGHEQTLAGRIKENPKAFDRYVRNNRMTRVGIGPVKERIGKLCVDPVEIGDVLNDYFSSVFTEEQENIVEEATELRATRIERIKAFEKWKEEKDMYQMGKIKKQKEIEKEKKRKEKEEVTEKKKDNFAALNKWNSNKKVALKQKMKENAKEEEKKKTEEEYTKYEREEMASTMYEKWLDIMLSTLEAFNSVEQKEKQQKHDKKQRKIRRILLHSESPPPWSPPNKTIPFGK
ncbi:inner centromere protein A-like isoform X5 [Stegostoma tigrinum]|uniref:inner centromere protein A-like isoform X5 n=1 Tax=Stegostoma tigrinum TaxID=3053191 RepID=UPI00287067AB|nr:inner centromere protein A-like isoform X5 [Stegostoma tigrinum]